MSSQKRKSQIGQETGGGEEKVVLTIEIPKAFVAEFKANQERVTQAATKVVLDLIAAQDPLKSVLSVEPDLAKKIFGYLDQRSLAEARKVSESWKDYVDNETSYLEDLALEASQLKSLSQAVGRGSWQIQRQWQVPDSRLDLVEHMIENEKSKCDFKEALELAATNGQIDIVKQLLLSMKAEDVKSSKVLHSLSKGT